MNHKLDRSMKIIFLYLQVSLTRLLQSTHSIDWFRSNSDKGNLLYDCRYFVSVSINFLNLAFAYRFKNNVLNSNDNLNIFVFSLLFVAWHFTGVQNGDMFVLFFCMYIITDKAKKHLIDSSHTTKHFLIDYINLEW